MAALTLQFSLTQAGQQSIFTQNNLGLQLNFTHLQAGSGQYAATGLEIKLKTPVQAVTLADGGRSADGLSINMLAVLEGNSNFAIGELGLWAGDPSLASSVLVAVWSETKAQIAVKLGLAAGYDPNTAYIGFKSSGSAWQFAHTLSIADAGAGVINVTVDPSASVAANLLRNHTSETNPHPNSRETIEINNAIKNSGQILNPANNLSQNSSQLWKAISSAKCATARTGTISGEITVGQVLTNTLNFVAPCDGVVLLNGAVTCAGKAGAYEQMLLVSGVEFIGTSSELTSFTITKAFCTKGISYTFTQRVRVKASGANYLDAYLSYLFLAGS